MSFILVYKQVSVFLKNFSKVTRFRLASSLASFNTTNALYMEISRQLMTVSEGNSEFWGSKTHYFPLGRSSRVL